jgi:hypothetical protein
MEQRLKPGTAAMDGNVICRINCSLFVILYDAIFISFEL